MSSTDKTLTKESGSDEKIEISSVASWNNFEHSAAEERRLVRKLDGRILPIACLLYLFACWFLSSVRLPLPLI